MKSTFSLLDFIGDFLCIRWLLKSITSPGGCSLPFVVSIVDHFILMASPHLKPGFQQLLVNIFEQLAVTNTNKDPLEYSTLHIRIQAPTLICLLLSPTKGIKLICDTSSLDKFPGSKHGPSLIVHVALVGPTQNKPVEPWHFCKADYTRTILYSFFYYKE